MSNNTIDDGFGNCWTKCRRPHCGLEVVRPGKAQCWCDDEDGPLWELPGQLDILGGEAS